MLIVAAGGRRAAERGDCDTREGANEDLRHGECVVHQRQVTATALLVLLVEFLHEREGVVRDQSVTGAAGRREADAEVLLCRGRRAAPLASRSQQEVECQRSQHQHPLSPETRVEGVDSERRED